MTEVKTEVPPINIPDNNHENSSGVWGEMTLATALLVSQVAGIAGCSDNAPVPPPAAGGNRAVAASIDEVSSFSIDEDFFAIGTDMTITSGGQELGTVQQHNFSFATKFTYYDREGRTQATARQKILSFGVEIEIHDKDGLLIGTVEEKVFESMLSFKSQYVIKDSNDVVIAKSEKLDFFGTTVEIKDNDGEVIATIEKPALNLGGDNWKIHADGKIDKRLLIFIPGFKTNADNVRASESNSSK